MRTVRRLAFLALFALMPLKAHADPIEVGDVVKASNLSGVAGVGELNLRDVNDSAEWIITFCLQKTAYMAEGVKLIVASINEGTLNEPDNTGGVEGKDPISSQTAWLYTQFTDSLLSNYDYTNTGNSVFANRKIAASTLQHAIWGFENEEALDPNNYFVQLALKNTPENFGIGDIAVLNLNTYSADAPGHLGADAQDVLTRKIPEPTTLALMGMGMLGASFRLRRAKR